MSEMVERVAKAIEEAEPDTRGDGRRLARAAIAAMDPTPEMIEAMVRVLTKCGWTPYPSWKPLAYEAFTVALTESLK